MLTLSLMKPRRLIGAALVVAFGASLASPSQATTAAPVDAQDRFTIPPTDDGLPGTGPIRRYEWFATVWHDRRSTWARQVDQDQHAVVFLGDSITQGWGGGLGAAFPGVKVANRGISGDTTRGVLVRLQEDVIALNPSAVVILIGTNDLEEGATPEVIASNLKLLVAGLESPRPAHADRAVPGVPELRDDEAARRQDQGRQRALPRGGEGRSTGDLSGDLAALRGRRRRRHPERVSRPAPPERGGVRQVGGGAAADPRDPRPLRDASPIRSGRRTGSRACSTAGT